MTDTWILLFFISLQLLIVPSFCRNASSSASRLQNVTDILSQLLQDYDVRLRPNFGGKPLYIGMDITLASFDSISEVNMDYTVTLCLNQYWRDERLAFAQSYQVLTLSGDFSEKIWVPDTFFANDKNSFLHDVTERNTMVRLHADGTIEYGMRFTTTLACMMDLHYYPLDWQNCTVEIESYGYTVSDVVMFWRETPVVGVEDADLPQFTVLGYETNDRKESLATGVYQRLSLSFRMQRNIGYFVFQTYLPSILIVMLSWVSFWINHEATSARVALGITTVLTMTTISTGVRSSLPRISYVKAIDIYLVMCFVFVFAALLEYAAVNYTYWGARAKRKGKKEDKTSDDRVHEEDEGILQLQDLRISPIPSLRNRHHGKSLHVTPPAGTEPFPPSFRIHRNYGYLVRGSAGLTAGPLSVKRSTRIRPRFLPSHPASHPSSSLKAASALRNSFKPRHCPLSSTLPKIKDVNLIDRFSRVIFPVSFILFNAVYWCFYVL